jgi:uncharacterized membrane protein YtjA (UPF0391 family)
MQRPCPKGALAFRLLIAELASKFVAGRERSSPETPGRNVIMYAVMLLFGVAIAASILGMAGMAASAATVAKILLSLFVFALVMAVLITAVRPRAR